MNNTGSPDPLEEIDGVAIETLVFQELKAHIDNANSAFQIFFYRTQQRHEVDFVLYGNDGFIAIEVMGSKRIRAGDIRALEEFKVDYPRAQVCVFNLGKNRMHTDSSIQIIPLGEALLSLDEILRYSL